MNGSIQSIEDKKYLILIVDDMPKNLQVLGNILEKLNCDIAVAMNGLQALESVKNNKPDLILLDVMMPELNGFETCKQLKKSEETKDIPIIFITARSDTEDIVKGFNLGAVDYVTKPFNGTELLSRVRTHLELKRTREDLIKANAAKNRFFSIIAHDLRSPFGVIASFIRLLNERMYSLSKEEIIELTKELRANADTTQSLLENLLEWSYSQTGDISCTPEKIDLAEVAKNTISLLQNLAKSKNIKLYSDIDSSIWVKADKNLTDTILRNLVSNAIKFTKSEGRVKIYAKQKNGVVETAVEDSGVGMSAKTIASLFRIDKKITTEGTAYEKGSGLGLILCHEFIRKQGGHIWAESEPGKGSTFRFTLPSQN